MRERLHACLDELAEHEVTWISAPPGGGKTTLVSNWMQVRGKSGPWYQFDGGDADAATFFYYLRMALRLQVPRAKAPPLLTPEYALDLKGFSRRFFRLFFHHLPAHAVCVFDNYHELPEDSEIHQAVAVAVNEIPPGIRVMVCSRTDPPRSLADALARDRIARIGGDSLRLTPEESCTIALQRGVPNADVARQLHELSNGWAAGLTLMIEHLRRGREFGVLDGTDAQHGVFDYFAEQILKSADDDTRCVLLASAFLPRVNADVARELSGVASAGEVLDSLYRRQMFVEKSGGGQYQFHPLFQSFLRSEAARRATAGQLTEQMRRSAHLLVHSEYWASAFDLYTRIEDWSSAKKMVVEYAPRLLSQGRHQTLGAWMERLPEPIRGTDPWIDYWAGRLLLARDPRGARAIFEDIYARGPVQQSERSRLFASTAVLEALYYEFSDFKAMDPWIPRVAGDVSNGVARRLDAPDELRVMATFVMAATFRAPEHPMLASCVTRAAELLVLPLDVNLRVSAVSMLYAYVVMSLDANAEGIVQREAGRLLESQDVAPLRKAFCLASEGYLHYTLGRYEAALKCFDRCDAIADTEGLAEHTTMSRLWRGLAQRRAGMLDEAERTVERVLGEPTQPSGQRAAVFSLLRAVVAHDRGDHQRALSHALRAQQIAEQAGQFNGGTLLVIVSASIAIAAGQYELAESSLRQMRARVAGPMTANYLAAIALNESWLAHRRGDVVLRDDTLREALRLSRDYRARMRMQWYPTALSEMLGIAFENAIEVDAAHLLVRQFAIRPLSPDPVEWPWPVRVRFLGSLCVEIDGVPVMFGRKVPRKTLLLLGVVIALGGVSVPGQLVMDALWPQSEGDAAYRALTTSLRRLRALLGSEQVVRFSGGCLSVDRDVCWSDVWAMESISGGEPDGERVLRLYRGPFLPEEDGPWIIGMRDRMRAKFSDAIFRAGMRLERSACHEAALALYSRAIAVEPGTESFYQGQMRCYGNLQRPGEALSVFQGLARMLRRTSGTDPSLVSRRICEEAMVAQIGSTSSISRQ